MILQPMFSVQYHNLVRLSVAQYACDYTISYYLVCIYRLIKHKFGKDLLELLNSWKADN